LRKIDIYDHPINLMYNEETTFKTTLGGFFTILARLAIFISLLEKKSQITTTEKMRNTSID
jgi:hypothetical protein